jgi:ATP-dependent DNA helicase RecG
MQLHEYLAGFGLIAEEGMHLEFKEARQGVPKSIWETISAFANTKGGKVLLGVTDDKSVVDLVDPDQIQSDVASTLLRALTPSIQAIVNVVELEGCRLVEIDVPEAEPYLKPVYITSRGVSNGAYRRIGSSDIRMTDEDLTRIAAERSGVSPDQQVAFGSSIEMLDSDLIRRYRNRLRIVRPDSPLLGFDDLELLRALSLVVDDGATVRPNRACVLLFGNHLEILRVFPGHEFQVLEVEGTGWVPRADARPRTLSMPTTGLIELASRVVEELIGRIPEGVHIASKSLQRSTDPVHLAIREAVVNAFVHQDHLSFQPTQFRRFSDRLEIENPGTSRKPVARFDLPGSDPRNPLLARAFNVVGMAERVGSGILTMKRSFQSAGLTEPKFVNDEDSGQFRVVFYWHNLASEDEIHRVGALDQLAEDHKRALVYALRTGRIKNADYRGLTGKNIVRASQDLRRLVDLGLLAKRGAGSATYYIPMLDSIDIRSESKLFEFSKPFEGSEQD